MPPQHQSRGSEDSDEWTAKCSAVVSELKRHKYGWIFSEPVDPVALQIPDYLDVIKKPMDFGTVQRNLERSDYTPDKFRDDVFLTFNNAMRYNPSGHDLFLIARRLKTFFASKWNLQKKAIRGAYDSYLEGLMLAHPRLVKLAGGGAKAGRGEASSSDASRAGGDAVRVGDASASKENMAANPPSEPGGKAKARKSKSRGSGSSEDGSDGGGSALPKRRRVGEGSGSVAPEGEEHAPSDEEMGSDEDAPEEDTEGPGVPRVLRDSVDDGGEVPVTEDAYVDAAVKVLRHIPEFKQPEWKECIHKYLRDVVQKVTAGGQEPSENRQSRDMFAGGSTQSGKTQWKVAAAVAAHIMGVPCIVCTTKVDGMQSLAVKVLEMLAHIPEESRPPLLDIRGKLNCFREDRKESKDDRLAKCFKMNGILMVNDTASAVEQAYKLVCECKGSPYRTSTQGNFVLIMDEADAFQRTNHYLHESPESPIKLEAALAHLNAHKPLLNLYVSATLVPVFLKTIQTTDISTPPAIYFTQTNPDDYIGATDLKPWEDEEGRQQFLVPSEISKDGSYLCDKTDRMCEQVFGLKRSLLLLITSPRVNAPGGLKDQVQRMQTLKGGKKAVFLQVDGTGITEYPPGAQEGHEFKHPKFADKAKVTISKVLEIVDKRYGMEIPVVIAGYNMMQRGDSFRSNGRVPTHIACALGQGMSVEKMVQALGRATFKGKQTLIDNGFDSVRVLTLANDYDTLNAYQCFVKAIKKETDQNRSLSDVLKSMFKNDSNISKLQNKSVGNKKEHHNLDDHGVSFEEGEPGIGGKYLLSGLNDVCKELLVIGDISDFGESADIHHDTGYHDDKPGVPAKDFADELRGRNVNASLSEVGKALTELCKSGAFKKRKAEEDESYAQGWTKGVMLYYKCKYAPRSNAADAPGEL